MTDSTPAPGSDTTSRTAPVTRTLGRDGLRVGALGLGCMGMSAFYGSSSTRSDAESIRVIHAALDGGVTLLDTANVYGDGTNEELVGRAIADRRGRAIVATKFGIVIDPWDTSKRAADGRPEYVRACCEESLRRLRVDHIDLYYQHRVDKRIPIEETVGAMADLVREGKVRYLGLSEAGPATLRRAQATHPIAALQSEWSLWTRDWEEDAFPVARELGIGIVPYSPLGRGFLTGSITSPDMLAEEDYRRTSPRFRAEHFAANMRLVEAVRDIAAAKGCTPAQLALAWVLSRGDDVVPIPGTTKVERLAENLGALQVGLSAADLAWLAEVIPTGAASGARYPAGMIALVDRDVP